MAGPIYKVWMTRPKEAWYRMSQKERDAFLAESSEILEKAGGKSLITCMSLWSTESWTLFGVEEFPDIEATQQHTQMLFEADHSRYSDSVSMLGIAWPPGEEIPAGDIETAGPIYKLGMMRYTDAWYRLSEEEKNAYGAQVVQALEQVGGRRLLLCASVWSTEQWLAFGMEGFPSVEAVQQYAQQLFDIDHFHYTTGISMLGSRWPPGE